ncbi:MAG: hypothetical protein PVI40_02665 [Chlamydiota bacterium]|jgi:hypothetical protein
MSLQASITSFLRNQKSANYILRYANPFYTRSSLASPLVQKRSFHQTPLHRDIHAILIGGGIQGQTISRIWRKHIPELAEYNDLATIHGHLRKQHNVDEENISILYGSGEKDPLVLTHPGVLLRAYNKLKGKENEKRMPELPSFKGVSSLDNFKRICHFHAKKMKKGDSLWIILSGHGGRFRGSLLWNKYLTVNLLRPEDLKEAIEKFDPGIRFSMFISSCYSGQFLSLTQRNVSITSSSDSNSESYYSSVGSKDFQNIFSSKKPFLTTHAIESSEMRNFYASDSLTYYIESALEKRVGERIVQKISEKVATKLFAPYSRYLTEIGVTLFVVFDPTKITLYLYQFKAVAAVGKVAIPIIKIGICTCFSKSYEKAESRFKKTNFYLLWFTRKDRKLIDKVNFHLYVKGPSSTRVLSAEQQNQVEQILENLRRIKESRKKTDPFTSYYYLYDKAKLFLSLATYEEIVEFLAISKDLFNIDDKKILTNLTEKNKTNYVNKQNY